MKLFTVSGNKGDGVVKAKNEKHAMKKYEQLRKGIATSCRLWVADHTKVDDGKLRMTINYLALTQTR